MSIFFRPVLEFTCFSPAIRSQITQFPFNISLEIKLAFGVQVVIVVKGVKRQVKDTQNMTMTTMDKVVDAFNTSQVVSSFQKLGS